MRRFKTIMFAIFSTALVALFGFEVLAAVYLNISINTNIEYYSTTIGAEILGTYSYNPGGVTGSASYLTFSGGGGTSVDNVYKISGEETSYSNIATSIPSNLFTSIDDTLTFYVFIKNTGDRYIIPNIIISVSDSAHIAHASEMRFFDVSAGHIDPLITKTTVANATALVASVETEIDAERCMAFMSNSSVDNNDVWCGKITISLQNVSGSGSLYVDSSVTINVGFMADVQYDTNNILSVYQTLNQTSTTWTKFGYNAQLSAQATNIETNILSNLSYYLDNADEYGNTQYTIRDQYSESAIVYKDIDLVNVDIATGEIIGKLSDLTYDFEWYGRDVTLPAGTTLASGRTLATSETFTVDVYTYYPTMYLRRWVVGDKQWMSVSDHTYPGAVEIPEYYTATFEATLFNPDRTVAHNSYGIYPRSYIYDIGVCVNGSANYFVNNRGFTTYSGVNASVTQTQMMTWSTNLTRAWRASPMYNSGYSCASLVQGENYTSYVYNMLYIIKYANNNAQTTIGYGNTSTVGQYGASGMTIINYNGVEITTYTSSINYYAESEKSGGTIGVYNSSQKNTATYDSNNHYQMSASGFDKAGMNYGYNSTYIYHSNSYSEGYIGDKPGLYTNQFLTYNTGEKRYLCDGYVGSNKYTSVFCLGLSNPWGNIHTWIFGTLIFSNGTDLCAFVTFEDYDYENTSTSWYTSNTSYGFDSNKTMLENRGYVQLSYNMPTTAGYYRYLGVSNSITSSGIDTLVGLPTKDASTGSTTTGLCDQWYCNKSTAEVYGVIHGGYAGGSTAAGLFNYSNDASPTYATVFIGFRTMLR